MHILSRLFLSVTALLLVLGAPGAAHSGAQHTAWISSNHIQVIDLDMGRVVGRLPLQEFIHDMEFSVDGNLAYVGSSKGLRVADANKLHFIQRASERPTKAVAVSRDGSRVIAVHPGDPEATQAARKAGLPLPPATVSVYGTLGMTEEASWHVHAMTFDIEISATGDRVFVLVPPEGTVYVHGLDGTLIDTIPVVPANASGTRPEAMLSWMAVSPDGRSMVVPVTTADRSFIAQIDLAPETKTSERVRHQDLGHNRRIQGLAWNEDGSGVLVTARSAIVKFGGLGLPVAWQKYPVNYVDVEAIPGTDESVLVAPIFSKARKSGAVSIIDARGEVVRTVELPDMSPFFVAVRP